MSTWVRFNNSVDLTVENITSFLLPVPGMRRTSKKKKNWLRVQNRKRISLKSRLTMYCTKSCFFGLTII